MIADTGVLAGVVQYGLGGLIPDGQDPSVFVGVSFP